MKLESRILFLACLVAAFSLITATVAAQTQNRLPVLHGPFPAVAAQPQTPIRNAVPAADSCVYTFTNSGSNNSYMEFCVTANGNIVSYQSPDGIEYIYLGAIGEGYAICDFTTDAAYYDWSDDGISSNWDTPVVMSSSPTQVKLERTTTDGIWTLTQTIFKETSVLPSAKVTMALKNNSTITRDVYLIRWADVDPYPADGSFAESADSTFNSAWGYTAADYTGNNYAGYGLMIQNIGVPTNTLGWGMGAYDLNTSVAPAACNPTANYYGYQASTDVSIEMLYYLEIAKGKNATVNLRYMAF